jgi:hypothetical protein
MRFVGDPLAWTLPLAIAIAILWDGRRKPSTLRMAVGWTAAEIHGAFDFHIGMPWPAIIGVAAVTLSCLPGLFLLLAESGFRPRPVAWAAETDPGPINR